MLTKETPETFYIGTSRLTESAGGRQQGSLRECRGCSLQ